MSPAALVLESGGYVDDVAVGNNWAGQGFDGLPDLVWVNRGLVALLHSPPVDGEEVDAVPGENFEEAIELLGGFVADTCFDGEACVVAGVAKGSEEFVDFFRVA